MGKQLKKHNRKIRRSPVPLSPSSSEQNESIPSTSNRQISFTFKPKYLISKYRFTHPNDHLSNGVQVDVPHEINLSFDEDDPEKSPERKNDKPRRFFSPFHNFFASELVVKNEQDSIQNDQNQNKADNENVTHWFQKSLETECLPKGQEDPFMLFLRKKIIRPLMDETLDSDDEEFFCDEEDLDDKKLRDKNASKDASNNTSVDTPLHEQQETEKHNNIGTDMFPSLETHSTGQTPLWKDDVAILASMPGDELDELLQECLENPAPLLSTNLNRSSRKMTTKTSSWKQQPSKKEDVLWRAISDLSVSST